MVSRNVINRADRHWFSIPYAATLLGTIPRKVEILALREAIEAEEIDGQLCIAEAAVTALRRDPVVLRRLLKSAATPEAKKTAAKSGSIPPLGSKARDDQHVLPMADYRLPLQGKMSKNSL